MSVARLHKSDHCVDGPAVQSLSWQLSLTGVWPNGRRDICTRADMNVSMSFVLLSIVGAKLCLRTVTEAKPGRFSRAHQTPFQPPRMLQGDGGAGGVRDARVARNLTGQNLYYLT